MPVQCAPLMAAISACGADPPIAPGYVGLVDQEVTPEMKRWADSIVCDGRTTYGEMFTRSFRLKDGSQGLIAARIEHHSWSTDGSGHRVDGCFKGATLYHAPYSTPNPSEKTAAIVGTFVMLVSLAGTAFFVTHSALMVRRSQRL